MGRGVKKKNLEQHVCIFIALQKDPEVAVGIFYSASQQGKGDE